MQGSEPSELVVIGGRSGVGKSSVVMEMHAQLADAGIRHAVIEGDTLDLAWPAPWQHGLAEKNLAAIWQNYRELGYTRLIFTNTVSVLETDRLAAAMGDDPLVTAVLLTCSDKTSRERLSLREIGSLLEEHVAKSARRAIDLDDAASASVIRIDTDGRSVEDIGRDIIERIGWISAKHEVSTT